MNAQPSKNIPLWHKDRFFMASIYAMYTTLIQPRSDIEDDARREFILNIILIGSIVLLLFLDCLVLYSSMKTGKAYTGIQFSSFSLIVIGFISLYILSRKGYFIFSSYVMLGIYFIATTYGMYRWGVDLPSCLLMYAVLIIMSSILINTRFSFGFTVTIIVTILLFRYLQTQHITHPVTMWRHRKTGTIDAIKYCAFFAIMVVISWLSNREIEKTLHRARRSEAELKKERDLLEIKIEERTQELRMMQAEKLSQLYRFAEFGRLSSGVFHDFVNPLNALSLSISTLKDMPASNLPEVRSNLERSLMASRRMEDLIMSIKKQIQTEDNLKTFSLITEIEETIELLSYKARLLNVGIVFNHRDNLKLGEMYGSQIKFHQIAVNLISNAIDSYDGITSNTDKKITVNLSIKNLLIYFVVEDNGCGIEKNILNKIFDSFFTTKSLSKGTGLGLSLTKHIIEHSFHGTLTVSTQVGKGSIFTVTFPHISSLS